MACTPLLRPAVRAAAVGARRRRLRKPAVAASSLTRLHGGICRPIGDPSDRRDLRLWQQVPLGGAVQVAVRRSVLQEGPTAFRRSKRPLCRL